MDNVDIERMRRVMDRLYPPGPDRPPEDHRPPPPEHRPPPTPRPETEVCALLNTERELTGLIWRAERKSRECRRILQGMEQRSLRRGRRLRTECFLRAGPGMPPPDRPEQGRDGVLFTLRRIEHLLEELAERYRRVAGVLPSRRRLPRQKTPNFRCRNQRKLPKTFPVLFRRRKNGTEGKPYAFLRPASHAKQINRYPRDRRGQHAGQPEKDAPQPSPFFLGCSLFSQIFRRRAACLVHGLVGPPAAKVLLAEHKDGLLEHLRIRRPHHDHMPVRSLYQ